MTDKSPDAIGQTLQNIANVQPSTEDHNEAQEDAEELYYDPHSGTLEVAKKGEILEDRDRVPATQMVREGFFA